MRFVHSRCYPGFFLGGYVLDRCRDLRGIIEMGELIRPWSIFLHVPLDVLYQITESFPFVSAGAFVMDIAADPLNRIGARTVCRQPEHLTTGVAYQPLFNGFRFMNTVSRTREIRGGIRYQLNA